jgi:Putative 2/3 transmembrane domain holin
MFMKGCQRMSCWLLVSGLLLAAVAYAAPHTVPILGNKLLLTTLAAYVGYLISVSTFPYARPGHLLYLIDHLNPEAAPPNEWELLMGRLAGISMLSRAIIMGAAMLAVSLGL